MKNVWMQQSTKELSIHRKSLIRPEAAVILAFVGESHHVKKLPLKRFLLIGTYTDIDVTRVGTWLLCNKRKLNKAHMCDNEGITRFLLLLFQVVSMYRTICQ